MIDQLKTTTTVITWNQDKIYYSKDQNLFKRLKFIIQKIKIYSKDQNLFKRLKFIIQKIKIYHLKDQNLLFN